MATLGETVRYLRSKNAGPFWLTVDAFCCSILKLRIRKFIEWTEKSHRKFCQKIEVTPNEITITPLDEQFIEKAIKIVEERMSDSDFSVEMLRLSLRGSP